MLNENARAWVKALRSRKYKQNFTSMTYGETMCVLGVADDLAIKAKVFGAGTVRYWLSEPVQEWFGLTTNDGQYLGLNPDGNEVTRSLLGDNDAKKLSFKGLADIIESEPKGLFKTA